MSVAVKSMISPSPSRLTSAKSQVSIAQLRREKYQGAFEALSTSRQPLWLRILIALQRSSTPITLLLVIGVLPIYGWSVYTQRSWGQAYNHLEQLQRDQRQLIAANEMRKYQVTQQAEGSPAGLVRQMPGNTIFLKPEQSRAAKPASSVQPTLVPAENSSPIGY